MKHLLIYIFTIISVTSFAQDKDIKDKEKEQIKTLKEANNYVYEGNELAVNDNFVSAEMEYRKAISKLPTTVTGAYNLGTTYYTEGSYTEALYRLQQASKSATSKEEKYKAFHNIGNILMKNNQCQEAVDAYKNALRNNPSDNETRYNLALAKKCAEDQKDNQDQQDDNKDDQNKDQDQNQDQNQDENKDNQDKQDKEEGDNKEDNQDQGDQDKKDGEDQKDDEGKPKDDKQDQGKGEDQEKEQQKPQPQQGQLSPQQVKNLLEAMNNNEQKVQEKMNAEKQKGEKIQTEKDW